MRAPSTVFKTPLIVISTPPIFAILLGILRFILGFHLFRQGILVRISKSLPDVNTHRKAATEEHRDHCAYSPDTL